MEALILGGAWLNSRLIYGIRLGLDHPFPLSTCETFLHVRRRQPPMNVPYFFFGTMKDPVVLEAVLGHSAADWTAEPARLSGHRVERAQGYSFPVLVPDAAAHTAGTLARGLSACDRARIAYFEDSEYVLSPCRVETASGAESALVYLAAERLVSSGEPWSLETFRQNDRALLVAVTHFVMTEHYGRTAQAEMERLWPSIRDRIAREMNISGAA